MSVFDPCLYYLKVTEYEARDLKMSVAGVVMLDVDDFCQGGNSRHQGFMDKLRAQLKLGKWQDVYQDSAEYIGRTLRQLANFKIQASMKRYITEKLKAVHFAERALEAERFTT